MQLTQVITFLAIAIVGAVAAPGGHAAPPPPAKPTSVVQQLFCGCDGTRLSLSHLLRSSNSPFRLIAVAIY